MRWTFILECRPYTSQGVYGDRIVIAVWSYTRKQATASAIAGAVHAGWEVARVVRGEPDLDIPEDRIIELEEALRDLISYAECNSDPDSPASAIMEENLADYRKLVGVP